MKYNVEVTPRARKQLKQLPVAEQKNILEKIDSLSEDPRPFGYKKLAYYRDYYRVRVGNYRVIYTIEDKKLVVLVTRIADRRDAY